MFVLTCRMDHSVVLEKLCRVCGRSVVSKSVKTKYQCKIYLDGLKMVFGVDARQDNPLIHPQHFCHACKTVLHKATTRPFQHLTTPFEGWCHHVEGGCTVCTHYQAIYRGGRPKTKKRTPGRPPNISHQHCINHVRTIAPPPLQLTSNEGMEVCSIHQLVPLAQLECSLCHSISCCPVELVTCGNVVCMHQLSLHHTPATGKLRVSLLPHRPSSGLCYHQKCSSNCAVHAGKCVCSVSQMHKAHESEGLYTAY